MRGAGEIYGKSVFQFSNIVHKILQKTVFYSFTYPTCKKINTNVKIVDPLYLSQALMIVHLIQVNC